MKKYVVGFAFDKPEKRVALMLKARPDWQRGLLNGIGGHVEPGESAIEAMMREWKEETGDPSPTWAVFAVLFGNDFQVSFFRTNLKEMHHMISCSKDEVIKIVGVSPLPKNIIPNLRWLIPMAHKSCSHDWPFIIHERCSNESHCL